MEQKVQQAKWEMGSLQKCIDNLLKENDQLRNDLTKVNFFYFNQISTGFFAFFKLLFYVVSSYFMHRLAQQ